MIRRLTGLVAIVIAVVVTVGFVVAQLSAPEASAKGKNQFQLDLVIDMTRLIGVETGNKGEVRKYRLDISGTLDLVEDALARGDYNVDSFFDVFYVSNIGSSGEDGVSFRSNPTFDVFFEVDYKTSGASKITTEMVAMSLTANPNGSSSPQGAVDAVRQALRKAGGDVYIGHVTVLK